MLRGGALVLSSRALAWDVFSGDQMLAYEMLAATSAALYSSLIRKVGQPELKWMGISLRRLLQAGRHGHRLRRPSPWSRPPQQQGE